MGFGNEIVWPVLAIVGANPAFADGTRFSLSLLSSGDSPNVLDLSGVNVTQDFVNGLMYGIAQLAHPGQSYTYPAASIILRNETSQARNYFMQAWKNNRTLLD